jgi:hypothetical protein
MNQPLPRRPIEHLFCAQERRPLVLSTRTLGSLYRCLERAALGSIPRGATARLPELLLG